MKSLFMACAILLGLTLCTTSFASDKPEAKPAGTPITLKGHLIKGEAGVAALNVVGDEAKAHKKVVLYADGELANQVGEFLKKHSVVEVNGNLAADGVSLKLEKIEEVKDAKGGNGTNKGDKNKKPKTP
jgi:hypothetical protein